MAQVQSSFKICGSKKIIGAIHHMLEAIDDSTCIYGIDLDYEEDSTEIEATVENLDLDDILGWTTIFQLLLKANKRNKFNFSVEGVVDNDYCEYTAFKIECTQSMISKKELAFGVEQDEDSDDLFDRQEAMWDAEDSAMEELKSVEAVIVNDSNYDSDDYDAADEAAAEYFEE